MNPIPFSEELDIYVRLSSVELAEHAVQKRRNPLLPALLPAALFRMYSMIRATIPMMVAARDRAIALNDFPALVPFLDRLILEEEGHDVFVLNGLEKLGYSHEQVLATPPPPTIAELVGAQHYWINYHDPLAIVGYIKVVELDPATQEDIDELVGRLLQVHAELDGGPFSQPGFRAEVNADHIRNHYLEYFVKHVDLERAHNDHLDSFLDGNVFTTKQKSLIMTSAARTNFLLGSSLKEICTLFDNAGARGLF